MFKHVIAGAVASALLLFAQQASSQTWPTVAAEIPSAAVDSTIDTLNRGDNAAVIATAYAQHGPTLNSWALNAAFATEHQRDVVYCVALAVLRSEGFLTRETVPKPATHAQARGNLDWAIRAIEDLAMLSLVPERHIAEAWARDQSLRNAALNLLRKLKAEGRLENEVQQRLLARLELELAGVERT